MNADDIVCDYMPSGLRMGSLRHTGATEYVWQPRPTVAADADIEIELEPDGPA